jgi:hypothetical protein
VITEELGKIEGQEWEEQEAVDGEDAIVDLLSKTAWSWTSFIRVSERFFGSVAPMGRSNGLPHEEPILRWRSTLT